jgi:DHHC palmitoyltransferase
VRTGFVVARMDHYCVWLNNAIGYRNHRTFVLFLLMHVATCVLFAALIIRSVTLAILCASPHFSPLNLCRACRVVVSQGTVSTDSGDRGFVPIVMPRGRESSRQ